MTEIENIIYPEIAFIDKGDVIEVFTRVRKSCRGKWYLMDYKNGTQIQGKMDLVLEKEKLLAKLHFDVYLILIVGEVNPKMKMFEEDKSNKSEKNRLIEKYKLYK